VFETEDITMNNAKPTARLTTPTDLGANAAKDIAGALNALLADTFTLYLKTKNFHWHVSGPHFRDYHLLLDVDFRDDRRASRAGAKAWVGNLALDRRYCAQATHR
jgi:hypothetical protein